MLITEVVVVAFVIAQSKRVESGAALHAFTTELIHHVLVCPRLICCRLVRHVLFVKSTEQIDWGLIVLIRVNQLLLIVETPSVEAGVREGATDVERLFLLILLILHK